MECTCEEMMMMMIKYDGKTIKIVCSIKTKRLLVRNIFYVSKNKVREEGKNQFLRENYEFMK